MASTHQRLSEILGRYMSSVNADSLVGRALRDARLRADGLTAANVGAVLPTLESGIRLFVAPERQAQLRHELQRLTRDDNLDGTTEGFEIRVEADISVARMRARELCDRLGVRTVTMQKVATIVSELARNIVNYTPGGRIELTVIRDTARRIRIVATDHGRGIANLDEILGGHYKSRTGLGKGLLGVKRLSDAFDVKSDARGTLVDVTVTV